MSFKKKILLSLSIFFSFLIIAVAGVAVSAKTSAPVLPLQEVEAEEKEKVLIVQNPVKNPVQASLNFTYQPEALSTSASSASTKVYEFAFTNTGSENMGVDLYTNLTDMVGEGSETNVNVSYTHSATKLTDFSNVTTTYEIPTIASNNTEYVYVLLTVIDKTQPVTFATSIDWVYGKPVVVTCYIPDMSVNDGQTTYTEVKTFIASTKLYDSLGKITVKGGYGVKGWYSNESCTNAITDSTLVYDGLNAYAKLDVSGDFNPNNNPSWFALMLDNGDGTNTEICSGALSGTLESNVRNYMSQKEKLFFQIIRGTGVIQVKTENDSVADIDEVGQLLIKPSFTVEGVSIPIKKIESIEHYNDDPDSPNYDPNPKAVFSGQRQIKSIVISEGIETIGYGCFNECDSLTYIEVPSTVTYVNRVAFQYCDNLKEVKFMPRVDDTPVVFDMIVFNQNPKLEKITLPNNLTQITASCFNQNVNLRTINIPASVISIDHNAFHTCSSLTSVYFEEGSQITDIKQVSFYGCTSLTTIGTYTYNASGEVTNLTPSSNGWDMRILGNLRQIWHGAFYKCPFTKVIIPDTVTSLSGEMNPTANGHVFEECSALREVVFENGASSSLSLIPVATFLNCANLTTISDLPNAVNTIHKNAFNGCKALTTITVNNSSSGEVMLPGNLEMMNEYAFSACSSITKITIPSSFEGCDLNRNVFAGCEKLQTVIFEGAPRMIDQFAFTHCDALKTTTVGGDTFVIPEGVQFIGHGAFYDALGLEKVVLPGTLVETFTGSSDGETNYGIDKFAFQACLNLKSVVINSASIQTNKLQTLSSSIFSGCTALELVKIPANITTVGNTLFKGCILLDKITIDTAATSGVVFANGGANVILGQQAFQNCSGLTSIDLTTIKEIGRGTFYYCTGLTTVNIPATVETIQPYAFQNCTALQTASFDSNNQITELPLGIFESCQNLTNVTLSDNVTSIGKYAFYNCYKFNQKNITNGIQQLNSNAFMNCYALVDINLETIQVIADRVFTYTGLQELSIPAGVTQIGDYAFAYCDSLTSIAFESEEGSTVTTTLGANVFSNCNALTSVVITKNITALGVSMFSNCVNLRSVTFEALTDADSSLETISSRAFYGTAITTITLPDSVITIDTWAFAKCTGLVSIQMDGVVTIGHQAFSGCSSLAKTIVGGELKTGFITTDVLTTIGYGAFHNCKALTTLQLGNNVSAIQGHSFLATGLTSAKFAIGGGTWKLYASKEGEKSGTTVYATITINETGDGFTDASTTQTLVDGLTSTTTHTSAHSTRYYVHLYWEKQ